MRRRKSPGPHQPASELMSSGSETGITVLLAASSPTILTPFNPRRAPADIRVTFEDAALHFSKEEWCLLDEAQRHLFLKVMLENFELISLLGSSPSGPGVPKGCCCGAEDVEAPTEQHVSVRVSQAKNPNVAVSSQKSHPCESCGPVLRDIFHLLEEQGTQHSLKLLRCGACAKQFYFSKNAIGCNQTLAQDHGICNGIQCFVCRECEKTFTKISDLHYHQELHTGERPYKCSEYGKSFINNCELTYHRKFHTGERTYVCSQCGKSLTTHIGLSYHERLHAGERPYECSQCGKSFTLSDGLSHHQRLHNGERPYECSQCGKSFTSKSSLHCHQRIHTGERPYACTKCGKSFALNNQLHHHKRVHRRKGSGLQ